MKTNIDFNSKPDCCSISQLTKNSPKNRCTKKCRNRAILYLSLAGTAFLLTFFFGYYLPSSIMKVIWLITSGTLMVLTGISVVVVFQCTKLVADDTYISEEQKL